MAIEKNIVVEYNYIIIENQVDEHKANKEVTKRIGEERALIHAHNKKGNGLGTPWKETHY